MPERKAHVKRVFALNIDGTLDPDVFVDVLRLDMIPISLQSRDDGAQGEILNYYLQWNDDPNNPKEGIDNSGADVQGENANSSGSRKTEQLKITNPDSPDDLTQTLKLWIIDNVRVARDGDDSGRMGQGIKFVFDNVPRTGNPPGATDDKPPNLNRFVSAVKVVNNDLGGMPMADPDGSNPRLVDWAIYQHALGAGLTDTSQHLDVEIAAHFRVDFSANEVTGILGQIIQYVLAGNKDVVAMFAAGDPSAVDVNGNPSVVRTDPLQVVVNMGFGGLAVIFGPQDQNPPKPPPK